MVLEYVVPPLFGCPARHCYAARGYLNGDPILARAPSTLYQFKKLVLRHKLPSALLATLLVSILGFAGWMSVLYGRAALAEQAAEERRVEAERQADTARAVNEFLTERLLGASLPAIAQGRELTVEEVLVQASREIRTAFDKQPLIKAAVLSTLGGVLSSRREYEAAEVHLREAEAIRSRELGPTHPDTFAARIALVQVLRRPDRLAEADDLGRATLDLCRRAFGEDHELTLQAAQAHATTLWHLQRVDEAAEIQQETLERRRRILGDDHPSTIGALEHWNTYLRALGRTEEAKQNAQGILERYRTLRGEDHPATLGAIQSLADILSARGELEEAEGLFRAAYEGMRRVYGEQSRPALGTAILYAVLLRDLRRIDEAAALFREVADESAEVFGADDTISMEALQYLGSVSLRQRDYTEAVRVFQELLALLRRVYGNGSAHTATTLTSLSNVMHTLGRFEEAERGHREALEVFRNAFGPQDGKTSWALRGLVRALASQGKLEEARPLAEELLEQRRAIAERQDADSSQRFYYVRELLTVEPADLRDPQRALEVALEAAALNTDAFRPDDYWVALAYREVGDVAAAIEIMKPLMARAPTEQSVDRDNYEQLLVECYEEAGDLEAAEGVYRETLAARRAPMPADDLDVAHALLNLGLFLVKHDRPGDAEPVLRECVAMRRGRLGEEDWRVAQCASALGAALAAERAWSEAEVVLLGAYDAFRAEACVPAKELAATSERLVALYEAWGKPALAEPYRAETRAAPIVGRP